nr:MAG TPA: hypothetical protein [Caudoviricetes sp.]
MSYYNYREIKSEFLFLFKKKMTIFTGKKV